jgi:hypothetical protein
MFEVISYTGETKADHVAVDFCPHVWRHFRCRQAKADHVAVDFSSPVWRHFRCRQAKADHEAHVSQLNEEEAEIEKVDDINKLTKI